VLVKTMEDYDLDQPL